jgi:hypothetical protein
MQAMQPLASYVQCTVELHKRTSSTAESRNNLQLKKQIKNKEKKQAALKLPEAGPGAGGHSAMVLRGCGHWAWPGY